MSPAFMEAILDGKNEEAGALLGIALPEEEPDPALNRFLSHRIEQIRRDPSVQQWLARAIALREAGRVMVGNVGVAASRA
jgi:hypothetical protein